MDEERRAGEGVPRARELVDALCVARDAEHAAQVRQVELIAELCAEYAVLDAVGPVLPGQERLVASGGDGTPLVAEHLATELAPKLRVTILSAAVTISQSMDLLYRHPRVWAATKEGRAPVWQATQVAVATHAAGLSAEATAWVDEQIEPALGHLPWGRLKRKLTGLMVRADVELAAQRAQQAQAERFVRIRQNGDGTAFITARTDAADANRLHHTLTQLAGQLSLAGDTDPLDVLRAKSLGVLADPQAAVNLWAGPDAGPDAVASTGQDEEASAGRDEEASAGRDAEGGSVRQARRGKARATAELVIHLAPGSEVGRCEELGPVLAHQVKEWLGHDRVIVRPVIDLHDTPAVDSYEVPDSMARIVRLRNPYDVFPWSSRASKGLDLDHTKEFDHSPDAPSGQTCPDNLGPLSRRAHNAKTHAGWLVEQPITAVYEWISRLGYRYRVDQHGSHELPSGQQRQDEPVPPKGSDGPGPRPSFPRFYIDLSWFDAA